MNNSIYKLPAFDVVHYPKEGRPLRLARTPKVFSVGVIDFVRDMRMDHFGLTIPEGTELVVAFTKEVDTQRKVNLTELLLMPRRRENWMESALALVSDWLGPEQNRLEHSITRFSPDAPLGRPQFSGHGIEGGGTHTIGEQMAMVDLLRENSRPIPLEVIFYLYSRLQQRR